MRLNFALRHNFQHDNNPVRNHHCTRPNSSVSSQWRSTTELTVSVALWSLIYVAAIHITNDWSTPYASIHNDRFSHFGLDIGCDHR